MQTAHGPAWADPSRFARRVEAISRITAGWTGFFVQTVLCQMNADRPEGDLTIGLIDGRAGAPHMPVWLHLARIRYLRMDDIRETESTFIDDIRISWPPARQSSWPNDTRKYALRTWDGNRGEPGMAGEMARVEMVGPWSIEAIAQIIHISVTPPQLENVSIL